MQGWALVENPTDEDWAGVKMALISGRPISFKMDLYNPLFINRPVVEPELFASLQAGHVSRQRSDNAHEWRSWRRFDTPETVRRSINEAATGSACCRAAGPRLALVAPASPGGVAWTALPPRWRRQTE